MLEWQARLSIVFIVFAVFWDLTDAVHNWNW